MSACLFSHEKWPSYCNIVIVRLVNSHFVFTRAINSNRIFMCVYSPKYHHTNSKAPREKGNVRFFV